MQELTNMKADMSICYLFHLDECDDDDDDDKFGIEDQNKSIDMTS